MSNNDHNLLNFLKQNALFTNSPSKSGRKSKSRSKDKNIDSKNSPTKNKDIFYEDTYNKNKNFSQPMDFNFNAHVEPIKTYAPF